MAIHLSSRDKYRVMETMAGISLVARRQQLARANGDCGVDGVNSIAEDRDEPIQPVPQSAVAFSLACWNSSDGGLDLD